MLEAFEIKKNIANSQYEVVATYEERKKSRHKIKTTCGENLGWFLERGHVLEYGEFLQCSNGQYVRVVAAEESVSEVVSDNALLLTRAAYHLGNRHVPLQVGAGFLRYQHDHVLDNMVNGLGLLVEHASKPFHPENGAYHSSGGHHHDH
ncbi:urease accessory protein UreE [Teredinibacter haidensis]|uniref:urease accessory protein UreE n=1 Tax=Teredinibacter haidensis TaxID=2731755 RepID=UPI000948F266|nr:urease accessory protein UreE [Teredinibacter haidensis]